MKRLEAQFAPAELEEATEDDLKAHPELVRGYIGPMGFGRRRGVTTGRPRRCGT